MVWRDTRGLGNGVVAVVFWNLAKRQQTFSHLACLAQAYAVDVFILAECPKNVKPALCALNSLDIGVYREETKAKVKVRAITRLSRQDFVHHATGIARDLVIWKLQAPNLNPGEMLLGGVHFPSKSGGMKESDQLSIAKEAMEELVEFEDLANHRNTILVGDFNMHPYDPGMTSVTGVHGQMTRALAEQPDRRHRGVSRRRFYNPMWGLFGDRTPGPAGTYYWHSSVLHNPYWGMLDQVLVRPALIDKLHDLAILSNDGTHALTPSDGAPAREFLSDHLPLLFRLDV